MDRLGGGRLTTAMNMSPLVILTSLAAIASAAAAGMMYVFSTFVMRGLDRTGPVSAITAMRGMNVDANTNAPFLLAYFGAALLAAAVGVAALVQFGSPGSGWLLAGAIVGVLAAIVTIAFNVPLNNHLDTVDPAQLTEAEAAGEWQAYLSSWTAWNHVRTATAIVAAMLMLIGARYL